MDGSSYTHEFRKLGRLFIIILILFLCLGVAVGMFTGCKTTQNISKEHRSKVYYVEKDKLVDTVLDELSEQGYMIEKVDRELGLVSTKPKMGAIRKTFQARVKELSEEKSELILTLNYQYQDGYSYSSFPMTSANRDFYSRWFRRIDSSL